jgi:hypothetical protein
MIERDEADIEKENAVRVDACSEGGEEGGFSKVCGV